MKALKKDLQSIAKNLKVLTQKTEKIAERVDRLEKARPAKRSKAKAPTKRARKTAAKKAKRVSAIDTVLDIIQKTRNKKGTNTAALKEKTGFNDKKIWDIVNRLKKLCKIKSEHRGYYVKA